ncbi:MAG: 16S rRNA (uracil(1498)-N(3))-methyltransferase [Bacteroidales bacterium]|nr:16S rRNA (uracil(1498)-N(3))-methyltransferase [Bacteroidales bacterium]MBO7585208.1 16S rRNA (uracil(1498)-N(3))-methyltransferase [Bacteroidales bacterium]MBP5317157.1 16S rRNA (uracil(1498)-N(3))-methyltransferase [Bacteroidales bacterium]
MELFYSRDIATGGRTLDQEESNHCIRVLRHVAGDIIHIVDGRGSMYECRLDDANAKAVGFTVLKVEESYGSHPYELWMAVAPPKNIDRFEWFAEKATEIAVDRITPLFGDYSERKVFKKERCERIVVSAAKQSHKGAVPQVDDAVKVKDFLSGPFDADVSKFICYCDDTEFLGVKKISISDALAEARSDRYAIMIGPEGDFSREEMRLAVEKGWQPVSLGTSRLRIETAALTAVAAIYLNYI